MRYWFGAILFAAAFAFLWSGLRHRARVLAIASREAIEARRNAASSDPRSLSAFAEIGRPIVLVFLTWIGVKSGLAYVWFDASRWLSPFDLAGFYALLAAYGVSFALESKYRISDAIAAAEGERACSDGADTPNVPPPMRARELRLVDGGDVPPRAVGRPDRRPDRRRVAGIASVR